jgi:hypothetical protein
LHRFSELTADLMTPLPISVPEEEFTRQIEQYRHSLSLALLTQYREIFLITAVICAAAAVLAVALPRLQPRRTRAEPASNG